MDHLANARILHSKFVLKKKSKGDGTLQKNKACLVVCVNEDFDNDDVNFAPVVDFTLVKLFFSIDDQRGWIIEQLNFENAFVHGMLDRCVYVELLKPVHDDTERHSK